MPSLLLYALESDLQLIVDRLNKDSDIAFVIAEGPRRWRAVERLSRVGAGHQALWHRPSGPLPLLSPVEGEADVPIQRPFDGWEERLSAATPGLPFFGSWPGVIWLHVPALGLGTTDVVPMTAFGWIGNRYRATGQGAQAAATQWWRGLQRWVRQRAQLVPRGGLKASGPLDVSALAAALAKLQAGAEGDLNPPTP